MLLVFVGACQPPGPGGGQASTSESLADRGVTSTPFAEGEFWILVSDTTTGQPGLAYLTVSGVGDLVDSVEVVTDVFANAECVIRAPDSTFGDFVPGTPSPYSINFEFDGVSMSMSASSQGDEVTPGCSVEFTASVARSGAEEALFGFNNFDVSIQGQALVSGEPVRFAPLQLSRVRTPRPIACEESPTVSDGSSWTISNVKPAALIPAPPSAETTVVSVGGFGETISSVNWVGGSLTACSGTGGTFSFDGTNLVFESSFVPFEPLPLDPDCNDSCEFASNGVCDDGRGNELPVTIQCQPGTDCSDCGPLSPQPPIIVVQQTPTCSITFSGKVAECAVYLPSIIGLSAATQVLRVEGAGSFTDGENSGDLPTVYLTTNRSGGGPCGVAMIPTLPIIFFGLCGFRFISRRRLSRGL